MVVSVVDVHGSFENSSLPSDVIGHTVVWNVRAVLHSLGLAGLADVGVAGLVDSGLVSLFCGVGSGVAADFYEWARSAELSHDSHEDRMVTWYRLWTTPPHLGP